MVSVSVIVPTFQRVEQTLHTLELLLCSTGKGSAFSLEIIVADSTPDTSLRDALFTKFGQDISYVKPEHTGIAANKNAGAKVAKSPILIFCDSDIEVDPGTILHTIDSLKAHETAAAVGSVVLWRAGPRDGEYDRPRPEDRMKMVGTATYTEAIYSRYMATYADVFRTVGGYDDVVFNMRGEGSDLSARYWRAGYPLTYDNDIIVHHMYDAPDSAALRVAHPEWDIAKDFLMLAYKYNMFDRDYPAFASTVAMNFVPFGNRSTYRFMRGVGKHAELLVQAKPILDAFRTNDKPIYDFKFLEVFSQPKLFEECIAGAAKRLADIRTRALSS